MPGRSGIGSYRACGKRREVDLRVRPADDKGRGWISRLLLKRWGSERIVVHGDVYRPAELPGFVAVGDGERLGLLTYHIDGQDCEIVTVDSLHEGVGIGSALIEAVKQAARESSCRRLWLITTNDNLEALRFYQKRGFELVAVRRGAVDAARKVKPEIPLWGNHGIPLRDEIELEMALRTTEEWEANWAG